MMWLYRGINPCKQNAWVGGSIVARSNVDCNQQRGFQQYFVWRRVAPTGDNLQSQHFALCPGIVGTQDDPYC